jgi:hypothetical protein
MVWFGKVSDGPQCAVIDSFEDISKTCYNQHKLDSKFGFFLGSYILLLKLHIKKKTKIVLTNSNKFIEWWTWWACLIPLHESNKLEMKI